MIGEQADNAVAVQATRPELARLGTGGTALDRTLTRKEEAVLRVIMNPDHADKTNQERADTAGVSLRHWYQILADPFIKRRQREAVQDMICTSVAPMLKQSLRVAVEEKRDGFNDRKLLLSMGGFYVERQQIDHTSAGQPIIGVVGVSTDSCQRSPQLKLCCTIDHSDG